ncbi:glycosyltransferase family 2 protein [Francisella philomiragia]|uniref:glycosyltransferase family 2 protein n=1 Tax=Francisella philomiragia TaxID=28110 RepID=UPI0035131DA1
MENNKGKKGGLRLHNIQKQSQKNEPLITVITVVYDGEKYLEKTIQSVINQTYKNLEYIIIDGGSTDATIDIIKKYESQIDYWVSEPDDGIYDAMNKGIDLASGDWINFMNAGDMFYDKSVLESIHNKLKGVFNYGHTLQFDSLGYTREVLASDKLWKRRMPYCHQSLFVRANYLKNNMFDISLKISGDYSQYIKAKYHKQEFYLLDTFISKFQLGGVSEQQEHLTLMMSEYHKILSKYSIVSALSILSMRRIKQMFGCYKL